MTWAPCPHGVRTRGKKSFETTILQRTTKRKDIDEAAWIVFLNSLSEMLCLRSAVLFLFYVFEVTDGCLFLDALSKISFV